MQKESRNQGGLTAAAVAALLFMAGAAGTAEPERSLDVTIETAPIDRVTAPTPTSFAPMLGKAKRAVVSVYTAEVVRVVRSYGSPEEEFFRRFFGMPAPRRAPQDAEVEERRVPQGVGSGVIVSADGYILTNNHVVSDQRGEDADEVLVRLVDGRELSAEIVGRDPKTDVAVLKVDGEDLPAARIADSDQIEVGDVVFAIGNPMGVGVTVTQGIVSATGRAIGIYGREGYEDFIQTDASINPGNSGGPLVDTDGRVIGINSAILSRSGGNIGIGFAIPSRLAVSVSKQLSAFGEVRRGLIGVRISPLTPDMAEAFGLDEVRGVVVDEVEDGFPAGKAGIQRGDVIVKVDGREVRDPNQLRLRVAQKIPGSKVVISLFRDGEPLELEVEVGDQSSWLAGAADEFLEGVAVAALDEGKRAEYGIPQSIRGIIITEVDAASPFARHFVEGTVIIEVNDRPADAAGKARKALRQGVNKLYVYDRGRIGYLALRLD